MKVCFASPVFDSNVPIQYFHSMMDTLPHLMRNKIGFSVINETKNFISQARNRSAHYAINNGFDKLLFIDADISWKGIDVMALLNSPHKIIGGSYPFKTFPIKLNFQPLPEQVAEYEADPSAFFEKHADKNGEIEVLKIPTGFLMIDVSVFKDIEPFAKTYTPGRDPILGEMQAETMWFPMGINEKGVLDTEDWGFCDLAQKAGHKIYLQTLALVDHVGKHVYSATKPIDKSYHQINIHEKNGADVKKVANPFKKWPVNLQCFCGSGQKFKKCCESRLSDVTPIEALTLQSDFEKILAEVEGRKANGVGYKLRETVYDQVETEG